MAYAEKQGKSWRVRYKKADGRWATESGFATKSAALARGRALEADVARGVFVDPRKGQTPFGDWAKVWMDAQTVAPSTVERRWYLLEKHILPRWGRIPVAGINWFEAKHWSERMTCASSTTSHSMTLLSMILTGAVDAGYIPANPLYQRRRRTKGAAKSAERAWAHPDEVVQIGARMKPHQALLLATAAWTGMRWGELTGLHRSNCGLLRRDRVDGKLLSRRVIRIDPDVGSLHEYRERQDDGSWKTRLELGPPKNEMSAREVDLPPFLAAMLDQHLASWEHEFVFCGADGAWWRTSNWARRVMRPAADGREAKPRTKGRAAQDAWESVKPGLSLHGVRHGHQVWMDEDEIPEVLQYERLGHEMPGIRGVYSHPSPAMRQKLLGALERRWESLDGELKAAI